MSKVREEICEVCRFIGVYCVFFIFVCRVVILVLGIQQGNYLMLIRLIWYYFLKYGLNIFGIYSLYI